MARRYDGDRDAPVLTMAHCECEHGSHETRCTGGRTWEHHTTYGTYRVCVSCHLAGHMPETQR